MPCLQFSRSRVRSTRHHHFIQARLTPLAALLLALTLPHSVAHGQAEVRNPLQPQLVLDSGGHQASVRALLFTPDGRQLLSGGLDKVIRVWNLDEPDPGLARVLRPPRWRGLRGAIFSLALSSRPQADAPAQRLLAVAGWGVETNYGNILLYRYPGADPASSTGEVAAVLASGVATDPDSAGHTDTVLRLAFSPDARHLASASYDGTIRVWDVATRRTLARLDGHAGRPVSSLAYSPDGQTLFSAGQEGDVVRWNLDPARLAALDQQLQAAQTPEQRRALRDQFSRQSITARARPNPQDMPANDPARAAVNDLALSPDGRYLVIGRENGRLIRYEAANLDAETWLPKLDRQSAVEALAFSPDGTYLAVSRLAQAIQQPSQRPSTLCDVELYRFANLALVHRRTLDNRVQALAFSPDSKRLSYAGGDTQGVFVANLDALDTPPLAFEGQGRSLREVGFSDDGQTVAYAFTSPDGPQPPAAARLWAFHLTDRQIQGLDRQALRQGSATFEGSSIEPVDVRALRIVGPGGALAASITLEPVDVRWWAYSFIPPAPTHPVLSLAIATETGVVIYARQEDGSYLRTRVLTGHEAGVYALAPSPDGRWLLTGSADQTLRLWPLAGCDQLPAFGATFAPGADGKFNVTAVAPYSFAEAAGLQSGDRVQDFFLAGKPSDPATGLAAIDSTPPDARVEFRVQRGEALVPLGNTRRDSPALSLFVGIDREWVVWTPRGHYETSIAGDRRFLGWHRNGATANADNPEVDLAAATDYFTIDRFETELRQPAVLDTLLATADLAASLAAAPAPARQTVPLVAQDAPPRLDLDVPDLAPTGKLTVNAPDLRFVARALTDNLGAARHSLSALRVRVNGHLQRTVENLNQPEQALDLQATLPPGDSIVSVEVQSDSGRQRTVSFPVVFVPEVPPPPPARTPRLLVLAVGVSQFDSSNQLPPIPFAAEDARDVARLLADPQFQNYPEVDPPQVLTSADASVAALQDSLARLDLKRQNGDLGPGDTLVVWLETHLLSFKGDDQLALANSAGQQLPPTPALPAETLVDTLGQLADYGCRVLVLLDTVHHAPQGIHPGWTSQQASLARDLYRRNVTAFLASIQGPGQRLPTEGHGAFAQAVLTVRDARAQTRLPAAANTDSNQSLSLDTFRDTIEQSVARLTALKQTARCYIPGTLHPRTTLFQPPGQTDFP